MASTVATNKLRSNLAVETIIHDESDMETAQVVKWVDMQGYANFMALLVLAHGTGVLNMRIMASAVAAGSNSVEVKVHAAPTAADAAGDSLCLECSSEELAALGDNLRYVGVEVDMDSDTDDVALTYIRANPRVATAGLTPTSLIDAVATE
jgi:hypothetical protein